MNSSPRSPERLADFQADLFKAMAHPARVMILQMLNAADSMTVGELRTRTGLEASNLSQHLGVLRRSHLIASSRPDGQVSYRLTCREVSGLLDHARLLLQTLMDNNQQDLQESSTAAQSTM
ncbi:ArsR/SmtB family transcription factor [Arthrobacter monumenti]